MSGLGNILGLTPKQPAQQPQAVGQPLVQPQATPQYPVDWQNGQTSSGGQQQPLPQGNTWYQNGQRAYVPYGQNNIYTNPSPNAIPTEEEVAKNPPLDIPQGQLYEPQNMQAAGRLYTQKEHAPAQQQTAPQQQAPAVSTKPKKKETPTEAYNRVLNEPGESPSEAYKTQAMTLAELRDYIHDTLQRTKRTKEQEERENKRAKQRALYSAISDGLQALSNLYFTTKGAPNAYNPNASMSKANLSRWDKLVAQREKDAAKYMAALKEKYGLDSQAVQQELASKTAREKRAQEAFNRVATQLGIDIKAQDAKTRRKAAKAKAANDQRNADIKAQQAENQRKYNEGRLAVERQKAATSAAVGASTIAKNQAAADKYRKEASASGGGSGKPDKQGRKTRYIYVPRDGEEAKDSKAFTIRTIYGTEAEANAEAKKYKGAYVNQVSHKEGTLSDGTTERYGGYRYIPSRGQFGSSIYYDVNGNRIKFDNSTRRWVKVGKPEPQKKDRNKPNKYKPEPNSPFK